MSQLTSQLQLIERDRTDTIQIGTSKDLESYLLDTNGSLCSAEFTIPLAICFCGKEYDT